MPTFPCFLPPLPVPSRLSSRHRCTSLKPQLSVFARPLRTRFARYGAPRCSATTPPTSPPPPPISGQHLRPLRALWAFSRPHTICGSAISVLSMIALARLLAPAPSPLSLSLALALPSALLLNIFIVGLNQLTDIPLDEINKPYLPLPSGMLSIPQGRAIVLVSLILGMSFCLHPCSSPALRAVLTGSALLGSAYSLPPLRLKRFPLLASLCILCVRGLLVNACFYLHASSASPLPLLSSLPSLPPLVLFSCAFFVAFGVVIALLKDVPDIPGDRQFQIRTFPVRLGARAVFRFAHALLAVMYAAAALVTAALAKSAAVGAASAAVHVAVAVWVLRRAARVPTEDGDAVYRHYMQVWKAFYLEYLLLPLTAL